MRHVRTVVTQKHGCGCFSSLFSALRTAISGALEPRGVGVVVEARHLCMEMRGVKKSGGQLITSCMLGTFRRDARTRAEFLDLVRRA